MGPVQFNINNETKCWTSSNIICMNGSMNGEGFSGCNEGWVEMQPFNLMANGGEVSVTYTNA